MSEKDEDQIIDEEIVNDEVVEEQESIENPEDSEEKDPESIQDDEEDEEDRIITIGDSAADDTEEAEETAETPAWVKRTRKANRRLESENKRLKRQLEEQQKATEKEKPVELGEKPTLSSCNFDDKKYEQELIGYYERERKVKEQAAEKAKIIEEQNAAYRVRQERYVNMKQEHSFKDFADAEELVSNTLSLEQQGMIVEGADDSALLVYALGKNPKKLEELSKLNPIDFAFKVSKLEAQLKVMNKKAPAPEKRVGGRSSGGISGNSDQTLERLREDAAKTGDYTKVNAYKRKHKG